MDNFDLRKYLAEGKLLKEVMDEEMVDYVSAMYDSDVDQEAEEGFQSDVWSKEQYASNDYSEGSVFLDLVVHLKSVGGKDVLEGKGWKVQLDNRLPLALTKGDRIFINEGDVHRIHKGTTDLKIKIN